MLLVRSLMNVNCPMRRSAKKYSPPILLLIALFIAYWSLSTLQLRDFANDPGVGWHLLTGELIRRSGEIPHLDTFLASSEARVWIADQWLSDILLSGLLSSPTPNRGLVLIYGALTGLFLLTFMGVVFSVALRATRSAFIAVFVASYALKMGSNHFILRPVVFGITLFAIAGFIVNRALHRFRSKQPIRVRDLVWLIPLTALWANLHPSFGLGIILLAITGGGLLIDSVVIDKKPLDWRTFYIFGGTLFFMFASALINPYGYALLKQVFSLVNDDFFMNLNEEWKPIKIRSAEGGLFLQSLIVILTGAFCSVASEKKRYITEPLVVGFFAWMTLSSVRFLPFYAIVSAPFLARGIASVATWEPLLRISSYVRVLGILRKIDEREVRAIPTYWFLVGIISIFPFFDAAIFGRVYPFTGPFEQSRSLFPYEGIAALRNIIAEEGLSNPVAVAASPNWGGFIAFHGEGQVKPIIDDRNSLLGVDAYKDYLKSVEIGGDIDGYLDKNKAQFLMLGPSDPFSIYLRDTGKLKERWTGNDSVIFERKFLGSGKKNS